MGKKEQGLKQIEDFANSLPANERNGWLVKMVVKLDDLVHSLVDNSLKSRVTKLEKRVKELEAKIK